jgi:hypothetical protein
MLKPGSIVLYSSYPHRVERVSESRAVLRPVRARIVNLRTVAGVSKSFKARMPIVSISPNSELKRLS